MTTKRSIEFYTISQRLRKSGVDSIVDRLEPANSIGIFSLLKDPCNSFPMSSLKNINILSIPYQGAKYVLLGNSIKGLLVHLQNNSWYQSTIMFRVKIISTEVITLCEEIVIFLHLPKTACDNSFNVMNRRLSVVDAGDVDYIIIFANFDFFHARAEVTTKFLFSDFVGLPKTEYYSYESGRRNQQGPHGPATLPHGLYTFCLVASGNWINKVRQVTDNYKPHRGRCEKPNHNGNAGALLTCGPFFYRTIFKQIYNIAQYVLRDASPAMSHCYPQVLKRVLLLAHSPATCNFHAAVAA